MIVCRRQAATEQMVTTEQSRHPADSMSTVEFTDAMVGWMAGPSGLRELHESKLRFAFTYRIYPLYNFFFAVRVSGVTEVGGRQNASAIVSTVPDADPTDWSWIW